jgi:hypothetical protein
MSLHADNIDQEYDMVLGQHWHLHGTPQRLSSRPVMQLLVTATGPFLSAS